MQDKLQPHTEFHPDQHVPDKLAALVLGVSPSALRNGRCSGKGTFAALPYIKMGSAVRYRVRDLLRFAEERRVEPQR